MHRYFIILLFSISIFSCSSEQKKKLEESKESPKLMRPIVRKIWVPAAIEEGGKVFRDGHYKYLLENETVWSR